MDLDGLPVPDVDLRFWSDRSLEWASSDDEGGFWLVADVESAELLRYDVDAIVPAMLPGEADARLHVGFARPGEGEVKLVLPLRCKVLAEGRLADTAGQPLAGWRVETAEPVDSRWPRSVATDAEGRFRISSWRRGAAELIFLSPDGRRRGIVGSGATAQSRTSGARLTVAAPGVAGRVLVEDGGSPEGAIVRLRSEGTGTLRSVVAGADGKFVFDDVGADDECTVTAELAGRDCVWPQKVTADTWTVEIRLTSQAARIEGRAFAADGEELRFAWLRFVPEGGGDPLQTMTESDGSFGVDDALLPSYEAFLLAPGEDGRLVPGPKLGRCLAGARELELRVPR